MKTYTILLAQDVPHYGTIDVEAPDPAQAIARAKTLDVGEIALDPDWENAVCRRIVHIEDASGAIVAEDIALDGYVLHHASEPGAKLCTHAPAMRTALDKIAAIPLWNEPVSDSAGRADYIASREYDAGREAFEPSADTESSLLQDAVETARMALAALQETPAAVHTGIRVFVRGGVVQGAETRDGKPARVEVIDYDVEGTDPSELDRDAAGDPCRRFMT